MKRDDILTIGGVALGVAGAFLLGKRVSAAEQEVKDEIEEAAQELVYQDPKLTEPEATAKAAAAAAAAALAAAQAAEEKARLEQRAADLRAATAALAAAQAAAIAEANAATLAAAAAAQAKAEAERQALLTQSQTALTNAQGDLTRAQTAAQVAYNAWKTAEGNTLAMQSAVKTAEDKIVTINNQILAYEKAIRENKDKIADTEARMAELASGGLWPWETDRYEQYKNYLWTLNNGIKIYQSKITDLRYQLSAAQTALYAARGNLTTAMNAESRTADAAYATIDAGNLIVERCLTMAADIRTLGILLTEASRIDTIARAVTSKLASLEAMINV